MSGKKASAGRCFWGILILGLYFIGLLSAGKALQEQSETVFLTAPVPDAKSAEAILKNEKESEMTADVCFYSDLGLQSVTQKEYGRSTEVFAGMLLGNAALFDRRMNGFGDEDEAGCMIDRQTALELFGSASPGGNLSFLGREFTVRKVLPWTQRTLYIRPQKGKDASFDRAYVQKETSAFLMRNGLSGRMADNDFVKIVILFSAMLLPVSVFAALLKYAYREGKREKGVGQALWLLLFIVILGTGLWMAGSRLKIPGDWIPGRWSDFSFWQKKISETVENFRLYFMLPRTPAEAEKLIAMGKTAFLGTASYIFYLKKIHFFRENAKEKNKKLNKM